MNPLLLQPVVASSAQRFTADDYRRTPEGPPWIQLVDGDYHVADAPSDVHQVISGNLYLRLGQWARAGDAGLVCYAPFDVYLSACDVVQPDLLFLSKSKFGLRRNGRIHGPPDLVVEILSSSTAELDLGPKRALYARSGVCEMWAVDPNARQVRLFRFALDPDRPVSVLSEGQSIASPLLPGFEAPVSEIFAA